MDFNPDRAIYLQMVDRISDRILDGTYPEGGRIPSVREYAIELGVNNNTAMKTYELLSRQGVIYNQRGMGYYVATDAKERIRCERRTEFVQRTLPEVFRQMRLVGVSIEEVVKTFLNQGHGEREQGTAS